jgi:sialate O-acetylesterase
MKNACTIELLLRCLLAGWIAVVSALAAPAQAALSLPRIFSDHMVLQQLQPIRIWGLAMPFEQVCISLGSRFAVAQADEQGHWETRLAPLPAGGPYQLLVEGEAESLYLEDVLIGEVWVCAGQSNMEWRLWRSENGTDEVNAADYPEIRLLTVPKTLAMVPQGDLPSAEWLVCKPGTARDFSAVAYFFGRELHQRLKVPIGLIEATWGSTAIDTWLPPHALATDTNYAAAIAQMPQLDIQAIHDSIALAQTAWQAQLALLDQGLTHHWQADSFDWMSWPTMNIPRSWESGGLPEVDGVVWFKRAFELTTGQAQADVSLYLGRIDDEDQTYINGQLVGHTYWDAGLERLYVIPAAVLRPGQNVVTVRVTDYGYVGGLLGGSQPMRLSQGNWAQSLEGAWHFKRGTVGLGPRPLGLRPNDFPSMIFNGMIHPLTGLSIKGVIWYQGESDMHRPYHYRSYFTALVQSWRQAWGLGDLPFLYVQLHSFRPPASTPGQSGWATLRESQASALALPRTGMVVAIDVGDANDIHPRNKLTVGYRLSLAARRVAYSQPILHASPLWREQAVADGEIVITFDHVGTGLQSLYGQADLRGFAIAGVNGQFVWAQAEIRTPNEVAVFSPLVPQPAFVRYAWSDNPGTLDLYNSAGLPVTPFRTDTLPTPWQ